MSDDIKSLITAIILSAMVVMGINYYFPTPKVEDTQVTAETTGAEKTAEITPEEISAPQNYVSAENAVAQDSRIQIKNPDLTGSIRLKGMRFDQILLSKYKETIDPDSKNVELFTPAGTKNPYYAEYGWLATDKEIAVPDRDTLWTVAGNNTLSPDSPVTLMWENSQGIKFINRISIDENYLLSVRQSVENNSGRDIALIPYGLFSKYFNAKEAGSSITHEGFTGIIDDNLKEISLNKITEDNPEEFSSKGGWVALTEKYWFSAFIFDENTAVKINLHNTKENTYQLDYKTDPITIANGSIGEFNSKMYVGAKEIKLLDKYSEDIRKIDLAIDFGWYYFITKPFFYILDFLYGVIGNMGWAILLFAALLRLCMFPIANKSYESMSKMKKIQPKLIAIQAMYKDDREALQRATMALYQKEKVNPAAGCLPMFIQIPIFFSLYKVLNIAIEIRQAPFIGWIKDLSAPDPLTISVLTHINYIPSALDIGIWPLIYGITMFIQMKLNPAPTNKDQARMFALMPFLFMFMFAHFAVGLVIYWTLSNILSAIQQKVIMHKNGVK